MFNALLPWCPPCLGEKLRWVTRFLVGAQVGSGRTSSLKSAFAILILYYFAWSTAALCTIRP
jgi:hypothetical protein